MELDAVCLLCNKEISEETKRTLKERGIAFLINASKERKDKKHFRLQKCTSLDVHVNCHLAYIRQRNITAAAKESAASTSRKRRSTRETQNFDFNNLCFFCGDDASEDYIKRLYNKPKNMKIIHVSKPETGKNIIKVINERALENDEYNKLIYKRLINADNLVELNARYHLYCMTKFYNYRENKKIGRTSSDSMSSCLEFVMNYIIDNSEECQFSLRYILDQFTGENLNIQYLKTKLLEYLGNEIAIYSVKNDYIICYLDTRDKILTKDWYNNRLKNEEEEKKRIVKAAAGIILQEIRSKHYDLDKYPSPNYFLDSIDSDISGNLKLFLEILIKSCKKSKNSEKCDNQITTYAHCITSSVRPRSFVSPILLGLSSMMHKKHASKNLIDSLHNVGLCASYEETLLFEASIVHDPQQYNLKDSYIQFVFDNADHNTNTIDGRNTFHSMGGIMCVSPASSVQSTKTIARLKKIPSADSTGKFGFIPLKHFKKGNSAGRKNIVIKNIYLENEISNEIEISSIDFLWFYGKYKNPDKTAGWNGFMELNNEIKDYTLTKIVPLPFVNAPPSQYDTILTVLLEADSRCKKNNQKHTFVTFDQPLYDKAQEIVACTRGTENSKTLDSVIVRLGGFHTLMSYLGSIGFIMDGSGLKEAFAEIYAEISAEKALSGHAFSRAVRGHLLVQQSLAHTILSTLNFNATEINILNDTLSKAGKDDLQCAMENSDFQQLKNKFILQLNNLKNNGPTAQLWVQYFIMAEIMKQFIEAERTGNWQLHLKSMQQMLPYFHASGHLLYAKSGHLYLQEMYALECEMDIFEYEKFTNSGYFTVRRTDKYRSGIWSDMTIEQVLMRLMKTSGGLTQGRGLTESVLSKWILSMMVLVEVSDAMEQFCNVSYATSEQHIDTRSSIISRDAADLQKLIQFFDTHDPFPIGDKIQSISSGVIGDGKINCYRAVSVGIDAMNKIIGQNFGTVKLQRKNKVLPLKAVNSSIKVNNNTEIIDPTLIFQRLSLNIESKKDMKRFLTYELAPYPLSLFDEAGMRKTRKSAFYENFNSISVLPSENIFYVVDGGFLLHRVVWHINETISEILQQYIAYVLKYYTKNCCIVFDGYSKTGTKSAERLRRQQKNVGTDLNFDLNTKITFSQEKVLSSDKNKANLIKLLCAEFSKVGCLTKIAEEDAHSLIITTAIESTTNENNVVIVGEDVDLLVILTQLAPINSNIYFLKPGKGKTEQQVYSNNCFKYDELQKYILFLHAFTGCDTTSCLYKQDKNKLIKLLLNDCTLQTLAGKFYNANASQSEIDNCGNKLIAALYSTKKEPKILEELRFIHFQKSTFKKKCKLESLPPSAGAAKQHSLRTFYQIQTWLGIVINSQEWGWKMTEVGLQPIFTNEPLIPDELLASITCRCETACKNKTCGCRKHGLSCTHLCAGCHGETCTNKEQKSVQVCDETEFDFEEDTQDILKLLSVNIDVNSENYNHENDEDDENHDHYVDDDDLSSFDEGCDDSEECSSSKRRRVE